jgi:IclR family transcriptional regulator, KDG regulon repressor
MSADHGPATAGHACGVPALDRALTVLECLAQSRYGYSVSELSRRLSMPRSSVHLLLRTFEQRGYLHKQARGGRYRFGWKMVTLLRHAVDGVAIGDEARPVLANLCRATGLTAHMGLLEGGDVVVVERVEADNPQRVPSWVGRRLHLHSTAVGKALIAYLPHDDIEMQFGRAPLPRANERTIATLPELRRELQLVRERGYALSDEEYEIGVRAIGVPVHNSEQRVVAAIGVVGSKPQIPDHRIAELADAVKGAAGEIGIRLRQVHVA